LIEALCLTLKARLVGQPRQKVKVEAADKVLEIIEDLARYCPVQLSSREAGAVIKTLDRFHQTQGQEPDLQQVEVLVALAMGLGDKLAQVIKKGLKAGLVGEMNRQLQGLYDVFDRQGQKVALLTRGAEFCDQLLAKEI
jgi:hypothetical protein